MQFAHRWDGNSYSFIALNGYTTIGPEAGFIVFPPVYPIIIRLFYYIFNSIDIAGFVVSNVSFIFGSLFLYIYVKDFYSEKIAKRAIVLLSIFPTSYFFSVTYPESFYLLLLSAILLCKNNNYFLSGLFSFLITLTRPFGILSFIIPLSKTLFNKDKRLLKLTILFTFGLIAVSTYLWINYKIYNDPFAFIKYLETVWQKNFAFPWIGIIDSWKRGFGTTEWGEYKFIVGFSEAIASTIAWIIAIISFHPKLKISRAESLYLLFGVLMFTSTEFILSAPRYILSLPPFFIVLAKILNNKFLFTFWSLISIVLLFVFSYLFTIGHWTF